MQRIVLILVAALLGTLLLNAQDKLPRTRIYVVPLTEDSKTNQITFGTPVAVPEAGTYNNQPHFTANGKTMFFSSTSENRKADIYTLDVKKNEIKVWDSSNATAEYSPTLTPDGKSLSFVRVEKDDSTQHLYQRALRGATDELLIKDDLRIGYFAWMSPTSLALYALKKPADELLLYDLAKKTYKVLDTDIGRALVKNPLDGNLYYIKKTQDKKFHLMQYNPANEQPAQFCVMPDDAQDFVIHQGVIYASDKEKLVRWDTGSETWTEVYDFGKTDVKKFYRFAFSPDGDWLAVVSYEGEKP